MVASTIHPHGDGSGTLRRLRWCQVHSDTSSGTRKGKCKAGEPSSSALGGFWACRHRERAVHRLLIFIFLSLWQIYPKHQSVHPILLQPGPPRQSCFSNTPLAEMRGFMGSNDAIPAPAIQACDETTPVTISFVTYVRLPSQNCQYQTLTDKQMPKIR